MKKFISWILLVLVIIPSGICESVDIYSMSNDELVEIFESAREEMLDRGIITELEEGQLLLYVGTYVVGKDIAPGRYDISQTGDLHYTVVIEKYEGAMLDYKNLYDEYVANRDKYESGELQEEPEYPETIDYCIVHDYISEPITIDLSEGQVLNVTYDYFGDDKKLTIKKSTDLFMDE